MLVVRRLATEGPCLRAYPAPGWQVGGGHSRHVPARGAIAGVGHNWPGGHPWGKGYGVDFSLSAEQRELTEAAAAFARRELNQDLLKREAAGEFPREAWRRCARFGVQGLPVPAELGGAGSDVVTTALVIEALGYGCRDNGLLFSLNAQMWSVQLPLLTFGTPAQQRAYLPGMVSGDLAVSSSFEKMGLRTWGSSGISRDAVASTIYSGTSEIQRVVLARMLGL